MNTELNPDVHHYGVEDTKVTFDGEGTLIINTCILHRHPVTGDSDIIKFAPSIVFAMITKLWTDITTTHSFLHFPSLGISDLNNKWHDTILMTINN